MKKEAKQFRIKVGEKMDFGTKQYCNDTLARMTEAFRGDVLKRFGLERNETTFNDLMSGGTESVARYRERLEAELPVNSVLTYIAEKAQAELDQALGELYRFIESLQKLQSGGKNFHSMYLAAEYVRFDDEAGRVVLTEKGQEALENETGYYLTSKKQLDCFNLASEIVKKYKKLSALVADCRPLKVIDDGLQGVIRIDTGGNAEVRVENIVRI